MSIQKKTLARLYRLDCQRGSNPDTRFMRCSPNIAPTSHAVNTVLSQKRFGGAACTPKHSLYLVSANFLPVLPVLTPFSLSRGDTLSSTGSHPMIQHVYV
ncbi:hypothetical protein MF519_004615 [Escherichia coli]|nr:hypothetical protein [Escherichia coli]